MVRGIFAVYSVWRLARLVYDTHEFADMGLMSIATELFFSAQLSENIEIAEVHQPEWKAVVRTGRN